MVVGLVTQHDWGETWRRRGECLVCGKYSVLVASCQRCRKWACDRDDCTRVIREVRLCRVPAASI